MLRNVPEGVEYIGPLLALLNIAISIPLIFRKVPPNVIYGFRTRKTLSNPRIWYEANALGGKSLVIGSVVTLFCWAVIMLLFDSATASLITIGIFVAATVVAVTFSMVRLRNL